jgi:hypothetical protein
MGEPKFGKRLAVDLTDEMHFELRRLALEERTTAAEIVRAMIKQRLADQPQRKPPPKRKGMAVA